jgi:polar amino acid transport system substrate-binding protein
MKRHVVWAVGVLAASLLPAASFGAELKADLIQLDPWTVENPDKSSKEKVVGIMADLVRELEKRSGITVTPQLTPYARVEKDLEDGNCDFAILAWAEDRARYANKGAEIVPVEFGVRAVKGVKLKSYEDLKSLTVSVTRGLKVEPKFDGDASIKKELDLDYTTGVKKATAGRVQAVAGSISAINKILRESKSSDAFGDTFVLRTTPITIQFSKKSGQLALQNKVNEVFASIVADGTAKKIVSKWMP